MFENPVFSVIVPVYNVEKYLEPCMKSLMNQTFKNIEIICINDGSTDNSLRLLNNYRKIDNRITVINKANEWVSVARNEGLQIAGGGYVLFVDSDDFVENNLCEKLFEELELTKADIIVYGASIFPQKVVDYKEWLLDTLKVQEAVYTDNCEIALFKEKSAKPFVWNKCYKKDLLYKNNIWFHRDIKLGEDNLFQFMVFPKASKVVFIENTLYNYRCVREDSAMYKMRKNKSWKIQMHIEIMKNVLASWQDYGILQKYTNELYTWCKYFVVKEIEKSGLSTTEQNEFNKSIETVLNRYGLKVMK